MCTFVSKRFVGTGSVCRKVLLCAGVLVFAASAANAEDHVWSSLGGGSFNYWLNWVPNFVPGEDDRAIFELGMNPAYEVTFYASATNQECVFRSDKVNVDLGGCTYTLNYPGWGLTVGEDAGQTAEVTFRHGTLDVDTAHVGLWSGSAGTLDLVSPLTMDVAGYLMIGDSGDGMVTVDDGVTLSADYVVIGVQDAGNAGTLTLDGSGAQLDVTHIVTVGEGSYGVLGLSGGAHVNAGAGYVGGELTGYGEFYIEDGSEFVADWLSLGRHGSGLLSVTQGGQVDVGDLNVGGEGGGYGQVDLVDADSRIDATGYATVGSQGYGVMNVWQQAAVTAETLLVGAGETGQGELTISDSNTTIEVQNNLVSGLHGVGTLNVTYGADVRTTGAGGWIFVGQIAGSDGYVLVDGGATLTAENAPLVIGDEGQGWMDILGGSQVHTAGELFMGWHSGSVGQMVISGDGSKYTSDNGYAARIGDEGQGTLLIEGGGQFEKPGAFFIGIGSTGVGSVTLDGDGCTFKGEQLSVGEYGSGTFTISDGHVALGDADPATVPSGEMHMAGYYTKLSGTGTVIGDVVNFGSAEVRPGGDEAASLAGVLTIDGDYTQQDGRLSIKIKGLTAGDEYGVLAVTGTAHLDGALEIDPIDGFAHGIGQQFTIMTFGSRTGEFASVSGPGQYDVTYNANDVTVTVLSPAHPGDLDCDGVVSNFDVDPFILALISSQNGVPEEYYDVYPDCDIMLADLNADGSITLFDVDPFVDLLTRK